MPWISGNRYLNISEMQNNAWLFFNFMTQHGWTLNAIAGVLGNAESESTINPGIWQGLVVGSGGGGGYGIVQWTPWTKYSEWAGAGWENNGNKQCERIIYELENNLQYYKTTAYKLTFRQFSQSNESPEYLAYAFLNNYERPKNRNQPNRQTQARYWYNFLSGHEGGEPNPEPDPPTPIEPDPPENPEPIPEETGIFPWACWVFPNVQNHMKGGRII